MTLSFTDFPKILRLVKLYQRESNASRNYVKKTYNNEPVKQMKLPNYNEIEELSSKLNLIKIQEDIILLTPFGEECLDLFEKKERHIVTKKIIRQCLETKGIGENIKNSLTKFHDNNGKRWYQKWDIYELFEDPSILPILYESGLLEKENLSVVVNPEFVKLLYFKNQKKITLKQLEKNIENQKIIGEVAEEIVLSYEKNRLKEQGFEKEAKQIRRISIEHSNAGYDIESFSTKTEDGIHDRFIEVKGTVKKDFDFHWSSNEIKKAKELGINYWIYHISEIDVENKTSPHNPKIISDPYENIFSSSLFRKDVESYHIQKQNEDNSEIDDS